MATYLPNDIRNIKPLLKGAGLALGNAKIESIFEDGSVHTRWNQNTPKDALNLTYQYDIEGYQSFLDFFKVTLKFGTEPYRISHPLTGSEIEIRILAIPIINITSQNYVEITFSALILREL